LSNSEPATCASKHKSEVLALRRPPAPREDPCGRPGPPIVRCVVTEQANTRRTSGMGGFGKLSQKPRSCPLSAACDRGAASEPRDRDCARARRPFPGAGSIAKSKQRRLMEVARDGDGGMRGVHLPP